MAAKSIKYIVTFLLFVPFLSACHANGDIKNGKKEPASRLSTIQLISRSLSKGEISRNEAALYKTYAIFDSEKLPQKFRSNVPQKDASMLIRQLKKEFDSLDDETREKIRPYLFKRKGDK